MARIPDEIWDMGDFKPIEDVILPLLRPRLHGVRVQSLIEALGPFPLVVARRADPKAYWGGDERGFIDQGFVQIDAFTQDPEGDDQGGALSEAVRVAFRDLAREQEATPDGAFISKSQMIHYPRRIPDWATSNGPVQYADLPSGIHRYETLYRVYLRYKR